MKLKIEKYAWDKIMAFTDLCPEEISGLGKVTLVDGDAIVSDVAIFEQQVSAAHSTIEPAALAKFQSQIVKKGGSMKEWCFWWHSHAEMGVFFSGTDTGTIETSTEFPYLVSLVVNKKHERKARFDIFSPVHMFCDLDVEVVSEKNTKLITECQKEIDAKVSKPKYEMGFKQYKHHGYGHGGYDFDELPSKKSKEITEHEGGGVTFHYEGEETQTPLRKDYFKKKRKLFSDIQYLKKRPKFKTEYTEALAALKQHVTFGWVRGYEVTKPSELL